MRLGRLVGMGRELDIQSEGADAGTILIAGAVREERFVRKAPVYLAAVRLRLQDIERFSR
jgi:hypothetical protein